MKADAGEYSVPKDGEQIVTKLVDVKKDLVMIPSLAIHMNRDANNGVPFNPQKELLPLYGDENAKGTFMEQMAALAGVARKDILAHDLYVYSRTPGTVWGASGEYISCGRLDDLQCAFSSLEDFIGNFHILQAKTFSHLFADTGIQIVERWQTV